MPKTKLNKEMYYVDFYSYKKYGRSISGLAYRAIQYGPVPEHYETVYDYVQGLIKKALKQVQTLNMTCFFAIHLTHRH